MPIRTFATNDVLTAADLNNGPFADAVQATVTTEENTTSTSYGALTTAGPTASSITLNAGQGVLVFQSALAINQAQGGGALMSFAVSGVETQASSDANAAWSRSTERNSISRVTWYVAGVTGSHTFTSQYKCEASGTAYFGNRRIIVKKF